MINKNHRGILLIIAVLIAFCFLQTSFAANDTIINPEDNSISTGLGVNNNENALSINSGKNNETNNNDIGLNTPTMPNSNINGSGTNSMGSSGIGIVPTGAGDLINLTITKNASLSCAGTSTFNTGELVVYTITVTNHGPGEATGIWVNETLPSGLIFQGWSGNGSYNPSTGNWTIGYLASGLSATMNVSAIIKNPGTINNTATVSCIETNLANNTASAIITAYNSTISVSKFPVSSAGPGVVLNGQPFSWLIMIESGTTLANLTIRDTLPFGVEFLNVSILQGNQYTGSLNYDNVTRTLTWTVIGYTGGVGNALLLKIDVRPTGTGSLANSVRVDVVTGPGSPLTIWDNDNLVVSPAVNFTVTKNIGSSYSPANKASSYYNGDTVYFYIRVTNNGPNNATGLWVNETLNSSFIYIAHTFFGSASNNTYNSTTGVWWIGNLAVGAYVDLRIQVRLNDTGVLWNNITIHGDVESVSNGSQSDRSVQVTSLASCNLTISKSANVTTAFVGNYVAFYINVTNYGPNATFVNVTDILPFGLSYISYTVTPGFGTYNNTTGLWDIGYMGVNTSAILTIIVRVDSLGSFNNTARITRSNTTHVWGNTTAWAVVDVPGLVNVSVKKSVNNGTHSSDYNLSAYNGQFLTYTITVTNHNNSVNNASRITVTDVLDSRLIYQSYSITIIGNASNEHSYNSATGVWTFYNLTVGSSIILTITVRINGSGDIPNNVTINTSDNNVNTTTFWQVNTTILPAANVTVNKTVDVGTASNGQNLTYTITVRNNGPDSVYNVNVTDLLDYRLNYLSHTQSVGTNYDFTNGLWTIGTLNSNSSVILTIRVTVNGTGIIKNNATVYTEEYNLGNNFSEVSTIVEGHINITIIKTVNNGTGPVKNNTALNGDQLTYTITVTNHGPDDATTVTVIDVLDSRLVYLSHTASNGNDSYNYTNDLWTIGILAVNSPVTLTITVRVNGTGLIWNNVAFNAGETNHGNNTDRVVTDVKPVVNITITKTVNSSTASTYDYLTYVITVTNHGPDNATNVVVTDVLDSRLELVSAIPTIGTAYDQYNGLWIISTLSVNNSVNLTLVVRIIGAGIIWNNVTINTTETNIGNNSSSVNTTVSAGVNLTVSKSVNASSALNGDLLTYVVTVRNNGPDNATGVVVNEVLDGRLVLLSNVTSQGTYNGVIWNVGNISVGNSVTMTLVVRINGTGVIYNNVSVVADQNVTGNDTASNNTTVSGVVNLTVSKSVNASSALNGDLLTYVVTVHNFGPDNATGVVVNEVLDGRLVLLSNVTSQGTYDGVIWSIGNISVGNSVTMTLIVRINGTGVIYNNVSVVADQNVTGNDTASNNTTVSGAVNLTVSKSVNASSALNGDLLTYVITVRNNGPNNATGVVVTDVLDSRLELVSAIPTIGTAYDQYNGLWIISTLPVNNSVNLTLVVRIIGAGIIWNNVTINTTETNIGNNSSSVNTTVSAGVNLTISKSVNASSALNGDLLTYVITVRNFGPNNATGVNVTEILDNRLVLLSNVTSQGTYNGVIWSIGNISVGNSVTMTLIVRINGTGVIYNNVTVTADQNITSNNTAGNNTTVSGVVNLTVTKFVNASSALNGDLLTYVITVHNFGPDNATGVVVNEVLDGRLVLLSNSTSQGTYNGVIWNIGNITVGNSVTMTLTVRINGTGLITNNVTVTADQNITSNNTAGNNTTVSGAVNLTVSKSVNASSALNGDLLTYVITVRNFGPDNATGVVVNEVLDGRLVLLSNVTSQGTYNGVVWNVGNITVGNSVTMTLTVRINGTGLITNNVTVTADQNITSNNTAGNNTTVGGVVNLTVSKSVNATNALNGQNLVYVVTVRNFGPDNATGVVVNEVLDGRLVLLSNVTSQGTYNGVVWNVGNITVGNSVTMTLTVRINGTGLITNNVTVTADQNITSNNTASNNTTVVSAVNLTITKTASAKNVVNGQTINYTIVVTNNGPDNATGVIVNERLPTSLIYVNNSLDSAYDVVTGVWTIGNLTNGQTVVLVITVRVNGTGTIVNAVNIVVDQPNINNRTNITENITSGPGSSVSTYPVTPNETNKVNLTPAKIKTIITLEKNNDLLTATLTDEYGNILVGKMVTISDISATVLGVGLTDENGQFTVTYTGTSLNFRASFNGDDIYLASSTIFSIDKENEDEDEDNNGTNSPSSSAASMKNTGLPLNLLLIVLLASLGIVVRNKKQ